MHRKEWKEMVLKHSQIRSFVEAWISALILHCDLDSMDHRWRQEISRMRLCVFGSGIRLSIVLCSILIIHKTPLGKLFSHRWTTRDMWIVGLITIFRIVVSKLLPRVPFVSVVTSGIPYPWTHLLRLWPTVQKAEKAFGLCMSAIGSSLEMECAKSFGKHKNNFLIN